MEDGALASDNAEPVVMETASTPLDDPVTDEEAPADANAAAALDENSNEAEAKEIEVETEAQSKDEPAHESFAAKNDEDEVKEAEAAAESVQDKGMSALVKERPPNPIEWLAAYLIKHNPQNANAGGEAK